MERAIFEKLHCNFIPVQNLGRAIDWYAKHLGWKVHWINSGYAAFGTESGEARFTLVQTTDTGRAHFQKDGKDHAIITFYTSDIKKAHEFMVDNHIKTDSIVQYKDKHTCFNFYDLDGNLINVCYF